MSEGQGYRFVLASTLWAAPVLFLAALISAWDSPARLGLIAAFLVSVLIRACSVVGEFKALPRRAFLFTASRTRIRGSLDEVTWVLRLGRLAVIAQGAPWRHQLLLAGPLHEDVVKSWARHGVRVIGMSAARLAEDETAQEFFEQS